MATYVIHDAQLRIQTNLMGIKFIRPLLNEVENLAKMHVDGPYSTGRRIEKFPRARKPLRLSFYQVAPHAGARGVSGTVGNRAPHARVVHNGASPHPIPRAGETYQHFHWRRVGRWVVAYHVSHPGMKGKRYLANALAEVGLRHRLRFVLYNVRSTMT